METRQTIFFAHSAGPQYGPGKGSYDLVRTLRAQLGVAARIHFPTISKPNAPTYAKYKTMYKEWFADRQETVILVGHSLGGSTLLKFLSEEKMKVNISALLLVSAPFWTSSMKEFQLKANFAASLPAIPEIRLYHSKKDEDVPIESLRSYQQELPNAIVHELPGKDHLFSKGLPQLLKDIRALGKA